MRARTPPHWSFFGSPGTRSPHITQSCPRPGRSSPIHPSTTLRPWASGHPPLRPHEAHRPGIGNNFTSSDSDNILSGLGDLGLARWRQRGLESEQLRAPALTRLPLQATSPSSAQVTYLLVLIHYLSSVLLYLLYYSDYSYKTQDQPAPSHLRDPAPFTMRVRFLPPIQAQGTPEPSLVTRAGNRKIETGRCVPSLALIW